MGAEVMSKTASEAAQEAADAIRALNYATLPHEGAPGLEFPSDVYDVIGSLKNALQRMPQALQQCSLWLGEQHAAGKVGHDSAHSGGDAGADVRMTRHWMDAAGDVLAEVAKMLNDAHSASAHLTGKGQ